MDYFDILLAKKLSGGGGGGEITVEGLTVNDNGTYTAPSGKAYSPVVVNLPLGEKAITANGEYNASADDLKGYSKVTVAVEGFKVKDMQTGAISSFDDGTDNPLKTLKVSIVPVQSGTGDPSPTNPRPISGWTGANVNVEGKNLLPIDININDSIYAHQYTKTTYPELNIFFKSIQKLIGKSVMVSGTISGTVSGIPVGQISINNVGTTLLRLYPNQVNTIPDLDYSNADRIIIYGSGNGAVIKDLQIEVGTQATEYKPFISTTYPITWSEAGEVFGGELDVTTGMLTVTLKKVTIASVGWSYSDGVFISNAINDIKLRPAGEPVEVYTEIFASTGGIDGNYQIALVINSSRLRIRDDDYTDALTFETAMANEVLIYPLATPITIQLTPTQVSSILGANNIWADSGEVLEGEYFISL